MMYFWGTEVKSGEVVAVHPGDAMLLHVSQACLGGIKKDKGEYVRLYAEKDGKKFVLGILSPEKFPHINFDVVFEDAFKLSHDGKTESVYFAGYKAPNGSNDDEEIESDDSDGEPVPIKALDNGTFVTKVDKPAASKSIAPSKPEAVAGKGKVKIVEPSKNAKQSEDSDDSDDDDEDDSDDDSEDDSDSAKPVTAVGKGKMKIGEPSKNAKQSKDSDDSDDSVEDDSDSDSDEAVEGENEDDSSDDDSEEDESDEETPKKPETSKKRAAETSSKTSGPDKKAKFATPVKNEGKKPIPHVDTPHPSKQAGKLPVNNDKSKQQSPKSGGSVICSSCSRTFGSDKALQSHSKAKHGAK